MAARMRALGTRSADGGRQSGTAAISDSSAAEPGGDFTSAALLVNESPCSLPKTHFFNGVPAIAEVERPVSRETQFHSAQTPAEKFITADYFPSRSWTIKLTRDWIKIDPGQP
jgi:hypothetical protein